MLHLETVADPVDAYLVGGVRSCQHMFVMQHARLLSSWVPCTSVNTTEVCQVPATLKRVWVACVVAVLERVWVACVVAVPKHI